MMPVKIDNQQPDGLNVQFGSFLFDTWEEAFQFILFVEKEYRKKMLTDEEILKTIENIRKMEAD